MSVPGAFRAWLDSAVSSAAPLAEWVIAGSLVLLAGSNLSAQASVQGDALRALYTLGGLGVVGREIAGETDCGPNAAGDRHVTLFNSVNGRAAATLEWRIRNYSCAVFLVQDGRSVLLRRAWDLPETAHESVSLVYYEHRNAFARVLERTSPPGLWVRIADVPGGRLRSWASVLVESQRTYRGYDGRTLHQQPSQDSPVIVKLRERVVHDSRVHQLVPTGEVSGGWGKFEVIEFNKDFYIGARHPEASPTGNKWTGWLRLVSSAGAPELWFFTRD
jgi:hypothetical protein